MGCFQLATSITRFASRLPKRIQLWVPLRGSVLRAPRDLFPKKIHAMEETSEMFFGVRTDGLSDAHGSRVGLGFQAFR
jgi:hypothetical protein